MDPMKVGILAYGSLIDDPGEEIFPHIVDRLSVVTPFMVEFARSSRTRGGAPTLVPVKVGGDKVKATVLVLEETVTPIQATNMLYRRETNRVSNFDIIYDPKSSSKDATKIVSLTGKDAFGLSVVLYTHLNANIEPLTPDHLAKLAVQSAQTEAGKNKRDGISYLINVIENENQTPLTPDYRQAILKKTGSTSLMEAWNKLTQQ